jgi:hypothetical protein
MVHLPEQSVPMTTKAVSSNHGHGKVYWIQLYVKKFVSVCGISLGTPVSSANKTDRHAITEIL